MLYKEKILFVDDEPNVLYAIKRQLHGMFNIETAESGEIALTKIIDEGPFAVIVVDMRMPEMDGLTALKELRKIDPNAKVVMLTALGQESVVLEAVKSGAKDFVVKPFERDRVLSAINKLLG